MGLSFERISKGVSKMAESYVQVFPNATGHKVATTQVTDALGNNVDLQRVVLNDPLVDTQQATVGAANELHVAVFQDPMGISEGTQIRRLLENILIQLMMQNAQLKSLKDYFHMQTSSLNVSPMSQQDETSNFAM